VTDKERHAAYQREWRKRPAFKEWNKKYQRDRYRKQQQKAVDDWLAQPDRWGRQAPSSLRERHRKMCNILAAERFWDREPAYDAPWGLKGPTRRQDLTELIAGRESIFVDYKPVSFDNT
jgi:hypothetical protein